MTTIQADPAAQQVYPVLSSTREDGVLTLTLNRPDVLNALTDLLLDSLAAELETAGADDSIRAIVITGAGRGFSSGLDIKAAAEKGQVDVKEALHDHYAPVIQVMRSIDTPIVAAVNGVAAGAGFSLALAADLRIAAKSATFVQAFVRIGLVPDAGSTFFLPALIGHARAAELMMLGDTVDAARALELGIVNRVVADDQVLPEATEIARRLAHGPRSVGLIKRLLSHTLDGDSDLKRQMQHEEDAQVEATSTADFLEGISAFLEKRPPSFTGR
jgi:2-(1,2-epoxy-1,2-dihydrophenyl)acetyl-CoA isomerase